MKASDLWTIRPQADPRAVIRGETYRITLLTSRLLRLEYEADGAFRYLEKRSHSEALTALEEEESTDGT